MLMVGKIGSFKIKLSSLPHGNFLHNLRLFYNSVMAFIFLYIDVVVPQRTDSDGGVVLIAIALYATFIIVVKSVLAIYNHFKWIAFEKCCSKI